MALFSQLYSFLSSLPPLKMQERPPFTGEEFLALAADYLSPEQQSMLSALSLVPDDACIFPAGSFCAAYTEWEKALRLALLRIRTAKRSDAAVQMAKREGIFSSEADAAAARAYTAVNPLEREKLLDAARWSKTEELTVLHIFDFDIVCAYFIRLQIAEKWNRRAQGNAEKNLDAAALKVLEDSETTEQNK